MPRGNGGIIGPVNTSFSGVWSLTEAQLRRSANTWPNFYAALLSESATGSDVFSGADAADPYFEYTTLLLPGNGTNGAQNNTFLDGSTNNFTITRNGNTTQGTFSPFSQTGWGNYFDGSGDALNIANTTALQFGTGDFTVESWVYLTATPSAQYAQIIGRTEYGSNADWMLQITNSRTLTWYMQGSYVATSTGTIPLNTWTQVAATRSGSSIRLFINGVIDGTATNSGSTENTASGNYTIGADQAGDEVNLTGYISNLRVTKGGALYTANFTPSTTPLTTTVSSGTVSLLTCQSNRFIDNSSNAFAITVNGSPTVVAFSPFNPTASWSAATNGGSGYFDGSGDYLSLSTPVVAATGDFTIEGWFYLTNAIGTRQEIIYQSSATVAGEQGRLIIAIPTSGYLSTFVGGTNAPGEILSSQTIAPNTWYHFAYTRNSNTFTQYLNGVIQGTASGTISINQNPLLIGSFAPLLSSTYWFGYLSNIRIVNGISVYTGAFTPPIAPLSTSGSASASAYPSTTNVNTSFASSTCSLLTNFTNAGIYDATSKNDLETVGNAQISTTQSKWGGSSMYFDGTADLLRCYAGINAAFGTGDFTIEMWFYINSFTNTYNSLYDSRPVSTNGAYPVISIQNTGKIYYYVSSAERIASSTSAISTGSWYHVAVARSGSSTKMFLNGTQVSSTYTDSTNYLNGDIRPAIGSDGFNASPSDTINGYIQDLRITKGYARYTANFTPPTAAFPTL